MDRNWQHCTRFSCLHAEMSDSWTLQIRYTQVPFKTTISIIFLYPNLYHHLPITFPALSSSFASIFPTPSFPQWFFEFKQKHFLTWHFEDCHVFWTYFMPWPSHNKTKFATLFCHILSKYLLGYSFVSFFGFKYIWIFVRDNFWIRIYIHIFVHSKILIRIYSNICSYQFSGHKHIPTMFLFNFSGYYTLLMNILLITMIKNAI